MKSKPQLGFGQPLSLTTAMYSRLGRKPYLSYDPQPAKELNMMFSVIRSKIARATQAGSALTLIILAALLVAIAQPGEAQTFTLLHTFNEQDGWQPDAGLTMDRAGNLYGTTGYGGGACGEGCGTVFELERRGSNWIFSRLFVFTGANGNNPQARVIFGPDGNLYGTTTNGGAAGKGEVFRLQPPPSVCRSVDCPWTETVLYSFQGGSDGANPTYGDLVFDRAGNLYGTTPSGGSSNCVRGCGTVYELSPSNGGWTERILYRFQGSADGANPYAGVILDRVGNLYGTSAGGGLADCTGEYCGVIYKLTLSESGWTESVLYSFTGGSDGSFPMGGLISDQAGNLYGVTYGGGVVYKMTSSGDSWTWSQVYNLNAYIASVGILAMDATGNLYGTTVIGDPEVFKLTPSNGGWTLTGFSGAAGDSPYGNVIVDTNGTVYGTASAGGSDNAGVVFEITP